jgi:hypothetical protein
MRQHSEPGRALTIRATVSEIKLLRASRTERLADKRQQAARAHALLSGIPRTPTSGDRACVHGNVGRAVAGLRVGGCQVLHYAG